MFVGEQLANIRVLHALSRAELAKEINVTEQAVWQYENGYTAPTMEKVLDMCRLFKVKSKFFYREQKLFDVINENNIAYRSSTNLQQAMTEKIHLELVESVLADFEKSIQLPENKIKKIRDQAIKLKNDYDFNPSNKEQIIEKVALLARSELGITAHNEDLMFLIEKNGAFIIEKDLDDEVDGYSVWTDYDRPYIVLNINRSSTRRNFNLAHELGHLLLHHKMNIRELTKTEYNLVEKEAHSFAANFLLPKEEFSEDIISVQKVSNPDSFIDMKRKWKVSISAIAHRAYSLGYMSYQQYRYFNASLRKKNYTKREPLDNEIPVIKPGKSRSIFDHIFRKNINTLEDILDSYSISLELFSELFYIEKEFFDKYNKKETDFNIKVRPIKSNQSTI